MGEILGRVIQLKGNHIQRGPVDPRQLIDRRAAMLKIQHHLFGDFGRKGRYAARGDTMIAGKDNHLRCPDFCQRPAAPTPIPERQILQPSQRTGRLGQLAVMRISRSNGLRVNARLFCQGRTECIKGGKRMGHGHVHTCEILLASI